MTILWAFLWAVGSGPAAYPIQPQPLRWLWRDAGLVVVAKAGPPLAPDRGSGYSAKVTLEVERVLKGTFDGKTVAVHYAADLLCPEPDAYPEGKTVLVFLAWNDPTKVWYAPGLSYGSKALEPPVLKRYVARLEELAALDRAPKGERPARTVEWLVTCMEHPDTRWEGAYDFGASEKPAHPPLTDAQKQRLLKVLASAPSIGSDDVLVVENALASEPDRRVDEALVRALRGSLATGSRVGRRAMALLTSRRALPFGAALLQAYDDAEEAPAKAEVLRRFLDRVPH